MYKIIDFFVDIARVILFYATIFVSGLWWWVIPDQAGMHQRFGRACIWLVGLLVFGYVWMRKDASRGAVKVALGYWLPLGLATAGLIIGVISRFTILVR